MPDDNNGANATAESYSDYFETLNILSATTEAEARAFKAVIPNVTGADLAIGTSVTLSYAVEWGVATWLAGRSRPLVEIASIIAGAGTSATMQFADINPLSAITSAFEIGSDGIASLGSLTTTVATGVNSQLQRLVDLSTSTVTFKHNNVDILSVRLSEDKVSHVTVSKVGTKLDLDFTSGDYSLTTSQGQTISGNLADATISPAAQAQIDYMIDAFDADFRSSNPSFAGIRNQFSDLSYQSTTGFSKATIGGWSTYSNGDFVYKYDTNSSHFEISSKTVNAHYGADGVQTIMYTDPSNGQWYFLQVRADGAIAQTVRKYMKDKSHLFSYQHVEYRSF